MLFSYADSPLSCSSHMRILPYLALLICGFSFILLFNYADFPLSCSSIMQILLYLALLICWFFLLLLFNYADSPLSCSSIMQILLYLALQLCRFSFILLFNPTNLATLSTANDSWNDCDKMNFKSKMYNTLRGKILDAPLCLNFLS